MDSWIIVTDKNRIGGMVNAVQKAGGAINAAVLGDASLAETAAAAGVNHVCWFETDAGAPPEAYAKALAECLAKRPGQLVLSTDSPAGRVLLGAAAAKLKAPVLGNVRSIALENDRIIASRAIADGKLLEDLEIEGPLAAIFDGEDVEAKKSGQAKVEKMAAAPDRALKAVGPARADADSAGLLSAARVVGVGLGVMAKDDLAMIRDLAAAVGAEIACTLPVCDDMRWFPPQRVVGSSHNQISPALYIAVGISGQPQHMSGVRDAKVVVAVNNDPEARIFKNCDYGILGDLYKIVPALSSAFKNLAQ